MRVAVAGRVEPVPRHLLAILRRIDQAVDELVVRLGRFVGDEAIDLGQRGGQAGQVEAHAANERGFVGFGRGVQPFFVEPGQDEAVDRVTGQLRTLHGRRGRMLRLEEGPVTVELGPLVDPPFDEVDLFRRDGLTRVGRRHAHVGIVRDQPLNDRALALDPGTTATSPDSSFAQAPSLVSKRRPAFRCFSSGP